MLTVKQFKELCYEHAQVSNTSGVYLVWSDIDKLVAAINAASGEQPADDQAKRIQELEAQLDTMERLKNLSQEALQEMRTKFDAARREAFEQCRELAARRVEADCIGFRDDDRQLNAIALDIRALQLEASAQPADERKDAERWNAFRQIATTDLDIEDVINPILESIFPVNEERNPTAEEFDAVGDGIIRALAEKGERDE